MFVCNIDKFREDLLHSGTREGRINRGLGIEYYPSGS